MFACSSALLVSCGDDEDAATDDNDGDRSSPEETGSVCESNDQCFSDVDDLQGDPLCLERVREGYCTHTCESDGDCCAAEGECDTDLNQVCSPFESTGDMMCFLSCEKEDIQASDYEDDGEYCQREASPDFICRSSGGGANNRKVCVPGDCGVGASCDVDADCDTDLDCLDDFSGGYCGVSGCEENGDCPGDSKCVMQGDTGFCFKSCNSESDCTFCRYGSSGIACESDVEYAEEGTDGSVCLPAR